MALPHLRPSPLTFSPPSPPLSPQLLGASSQCALLVDVLRVLTWHTDVALAVLARLYYLELSLLGSLWRLFRYDICIGIDIERDSTRIDRYSRVNSNIDLYLPPLTPSFSPLSCVAGARSVTCCGTASTA